MNVFLCFALLMYGLVKMYMLRCIHLCYAVCRYFYGFDCGLVKQREWVELLKLSAAIVR